MPNTQLPTEVNLGDFSALDGFTMYGLYAKGNYFGSSVNAGDVNGDKIDDLIIGGSGSWNNEPTNNYVVYGKEGAWDQSLFVSNFADGVNGALLNGEFLSHIGYSVTYAGDINGDNIGDLLIGNGGDGRSGYLVFGRNGMWSSPIALNSLNGSDGVIFSENNYNPYSHNNYFLVNQAGDFNGDEIDDLVIGKPGLSKSYVVFGKLGVWNATIELDNLDGANGIILNGENSNDLFGCAISRAGDINGDGIDDLIIGASAASPNGKYQAGKSYIIFGKVGTWNSTFELSNIDGTNGLILNGESERDNFGGSVSIAGDINGDGINDLIIGASYASPNSVANAGKSYLIFGHIESGINPIEISMLNAVIFNGDEYDDRSGSAVSPAGDFNYDGIDDLLIGALGSANTYSKIYLIFGHTNAWPSTIELRSLDTSGITLYGQAGDQTGSAIYHGDINHDSIDDLIIGAPSAEGSADGAVYVIFGHGLPKLSSNTTDVLTYTEKSAAIIIDDHIEIAANTLISATVTISNSFEDNQDILSCKTAILPDTISCTQSGAALTLLGTATSADYQTALSAAQYENTSDNPSTVTRTISFQVIDQLNYISNILTRDMQIIAINDPPVIQGSNITLIFTENDPAKKLDRMFIVTDVDSDIAGANVFIANHYAGDEDILSCLTLPFGVTCLQSGASLIIEGVTSPANYQTILRNVAYENISKNPSTLTRTISFSVTDDAGAQSNLVQQSIEIHAINTPPTLEDNGASMVFIEDAPPQPVDAELIAKDADNENLVNASISLQGFVAAEDRLLCSSSLQAETFGLSCFDVTDDPTFAGKVIVSGISSIENYNLFLHGINYQDISQNPNTQPRNILFQVCDGEAFSNVLSKSLNVISINDAPIVSQNKLSIDPGTTVTLSADNLLAIDPDNNANEITFTVDEVTHGFFQNQNHTGIAINTFTQANINNKTIQLVANTNDLPSYAISVSDGAASNGPYSADVSYATPSLAISNQTSLSERAKQYVIAGGVIGGVFLMFVLASLVARFKTERYLAQSLEASASEIEKQRSDYNNKVIRPIVKKLFAQIKVTWFLGYISEQSCQAYVAAIETLAAALDVEKVDLNFESMSPPEQTRLLNIIIVEIKRVAIGKVDCCSGRQLIGLFKPHVTPDQIVENSKVIAKSVKMELNKMTLLDNKAAAEDGDINMVDMQDSSINYMRLSS